MRVDRATYLGAALDTAKRDITILRRSIQRIEELATATPSHADAVNALDAIKGECERILSDT